MSFEFIYKNHFNTTTQAVVNSNTGTVSNVLIRDFRYQYVSSGFDDDTTVASMTINFDETVTISRIAMLEMNLKGFTIFHGGATANTFALTTTANTTTSDYSSNSATGLYMRCTPVDVTSVTLEMKTTQVANVDKAIGYLVFSDILVDFDRDPPAQGYSPSFNPLNVVHRLSDGGHRIQTLDEKFSASINLDHISLDFRSDLFVAFRLHSDFIFCPFGTTTGWDEVIYPTVWSNSWEFFEVTDNNKVAGYSGRINLLEVTL